MEKVVQPEETTLVGNEVYADKTAAVVPTKKDIQDLIKKKTGFEGDVVLKGGKAETTHLESYYFNGLLMAMAKRNPATGQYYGFRAPSNRSKAETDRIVSG